MASLSISPSTTTPQWPWVVYSQKQASTISTSSGTASFIARSARWTTPSACQASLPTSSFFSGRPNRMTAGMPRRATSSASRAASSAERWNCPGRDGIGLRMPRPGRTNSGNTRSSAARVVSRTRRRMAGLRRSRRGRVSGNDIFPEPSLSRPAVQTRAPPGRARPRRRSVGARKRAAAMSSPGIPLPGGPWN